MGKYQNKIRAVLYKPRGKNLTQLQQYREKIVQSAMPMVLELYVVFYTFLFMKIVGCYIKSDMKQSFISKTRTKLNQKHEHENKSYHIFIYFMLYRYSKYNVATFILYFLGQEVELWENATQQPFYNNTLLINTKHICSLKT